MSSHLTPRAAHWAWLFAAWGVALAATLGALFIGEIMGMTPCLLCWYQRIFMFPLAIVLGIAAFANDLEGPCGAGPFCSDQKLTALHGVQLPWLSVLAFALVVASLVIFLRKTRS
ncbi:disulfide bond formation protein B [uncultured Hydrogenophaga sp.]|uniref:disulfide bond formation protein B n=1 Tax=uncultured Hydrogenophaga sp. TaxID=199683 RepID=UPI0025875CCB|nr:disulfide bond formation protein B [uncultured Hydrogenophaga sp.]